MFNKQEKRKKEQITFRVEGDVLDKLKDIEKYHSKITDIIDLGLECYLHGIKKEKFKEMEISDKEKRFIRIHFVDKNGVALSLSNPKKYNTIEDLQKDNPFNSDVTNGWEDLDLREDSYKIEMYKTIDRISFVNGRNYKVIDRQFKPDYPVMLTLYLEEIRK